MGGGVGCGVVALVLMVVVLEMVVGTVGVVVLLLEVCGWGRRWWRRCRWWRQRWQRWWWCRWRGTVHEWWQ